jgi:2-desacetyl-2-hydroxyethyl bacteriochlorophyllide A dehydrogenase
LLIRTGAATICTSDLNDIRANPFGIPLPTVMGHEGAGTVAEVGSNVKGFKPGDRVATHPVHPCGECLNCGRGMGHLCSSMGHFGLNMPGTFAEYYVVRQDRARVLPPDASFSVGCLTEPVCVCLQALHQARGAADDPLLILGDGPFGVLIARLAAAYGRRHTVIAGHHDFRLSFARDAVRVNTKQLADPAERLRECASGGGYGAVILAVGSAEAVRMGLTLLRPKGRLVLFSAVPAPTPIDLLPVHVRELEIVGACNDEDRLDEAVGLLTDARLAPAELVTHEFALEAYREAFELASGGHADAMKVALTFGDPRTR